MNKNINIEENLDSEKMTYCEMLVMKAIWESEDVLALRNTTALVNQLYNKSWAPQTVSTFIARLVKKGFIEMERKGRQFFYHPLISIEDYAKKEIASCVDFWCDGRLDVFVEKYLEANK